MTEKRRDSAIQQNVDKIVADTEKRMKAEEAAEKMAREIIASQFVTDKQDSISDLVARLKSDQNK